MSTTKHLTFQKLEPVDMALGDAITPLGRASGTNSGIISTNPVDKTGEFAHMTDFSSLEPGVQCLRLVFFEHGHKLLAKAGRRRGVPRCGSCAQPGAVALE
jgi:hypothetical protein